MIVFLWQLKIFLIENHRKMPYNGIWLENKYGRAGYYV